MTVTRGTTNGNVRGNNTTRRQRREWLVETYRADVDLLAVTLRDGTEAPPERYCLTAEMLLEYDSVMAVRPVPACRCFRCGQLLTVDTVTADRIKPGAQGGTYGTPRQDTREGRTNIRPACLGCNSTTGGGVRR